MPNPIHLSGKPAQVLAELRAIIAARKPEPKVVYRTTILASEDIIWRRVPVLGRVPQ